MTSIALYYPQTKQPKKEKSMEFKGIVIDVLVDKQEHQKKTGKGI